MGLKKSLNIRSLKWKCSYNMAYILSLLMGNISATSKILWKLYLKIVQLCYNSINKMEFSIDILAFIMNKNLKTAAFLLVVFLSINN